LCGCQARVLVNMRAAAVAVTAAGPPGPVRQAGGAGFGGLPFAAARSLERSLESVGAGASGSAGGLAKSSSLPEAAEELAGVAQPEVDKQQVHYVRYACLSEGADAALPYPKVHPACPPGQAALGGRGGPAA
jgi:hypothetical protein